MLEFLVNALVLLGALFYSIIWVLAVVRWDDVLVIDFKPRTKKFINIFYLLWFIAHISIFLYAVVNHWV